MENSNTTEMCCTRTQNAVPIIETTNWQIHVRVRVHVYWRRWLTNLTGMHKTNTIKRKTHWEQNSPLNRISKQILKHDCIISHTLSLLSNLPAGLSISVLSTWRIFIRTTSSLAGLVPTKRACVTASERASTAVEDERKEGSVEHMCTWCVHVYGWVSIKTKACRFCCFLQCSINPHCIFVTLNNHQEAVFPPKGMLMFDTWIRSLHLQLYICSCTTHYTSGLS